MANETPTVAHLFAEAAAAERPDVGGGDWRSLVTEETVSLTFGFPFPGSFPNEELLAAAETLFDAEPDTALQYGGGEYADALPGIVAERCRDRGTDCTEDEVMLTNGASNAIDVVCRTFLDPGDAVFVEGPTFTWSLRVIGGHGVDVTHVPVDSDGLDVEALADELAARRREGRQLPTLLYTIPTFQNPTGTTLSRDRRERLLELAAEYDFVVLEDDAYGELRYDGDGVPPLRALDDAGRVIHAGTFSKTIAPGVRTGWLVADPGVVEAMDARHTGGPSTFTRGLLAAYCREGYLDEAVPRLCEAYRERRDHMLDCLERHMPAGADWTEPEGGFFVWVELPEGIDATAMLPDAIEEGVAYLPGQMFYASEDAGTNCLRLSFSRDSFDDIDRGIAALGRTTRAWLEN
jgi:2-aminoadipate transaminase